MDGLCCQPVLVEKIYELVLSTTFAATKVGKVKPIEFCHLNVVKTAYSKLFYNCMINKQY